MNDAKVVENSEYRSIDGIHYRVLGNGKKTVVLLRGLEHRRICFCHRSIGLVLRIFWRLKASGSLRLITEVSVDQAELK